MWLPYQLSQLTSSRRARNDTSKIENNKTQQPENTAKKQLNLSSRHCKMLDILSIGQEFLILNFHLQKTCGNVHENSLKTEHTRLHDSSPSQTRQWRQGAIDTHACVVVSKLYDVTNMQTKKTRAHFSRVSFGEFFWKFVYFMI